MPSKKPFISESCILQCANWWFDQVLDDKQVKDNGAKEFSSLLGNKMAQELGQCFPVKEEQRKPFTKNLATFLLAMFSGKSTFQPLQVDYGPCKALAIAAEYAKVDLSRFPIKTRMLIGITSYGPGVFVSVGYGADYVPICHLDGSKVTTRYTCCYSRVFPPIGNYLGSEDEAEDEAEDEVEDVCYSKSFHDQSKRDLGTDSEFAGVRKFLSEKIEDLVDGKWIAR